MNKEYRVKCEIDSNLVKVLSELQVLSGNEIYDKYGLKRDEKPYSKTFKFENGYQMDVNFVICEKEDFPYIDTVLFDNFGNELTCEIVEGIIADEFQIIYDKDKYCVNLVSV